MREIEIRYRRTTGRGTHRVAVPSTYAEMSAGQFLAVIRLSKGWIGETDFFRQFFGLSPRLLERTDTFLLYKMSETMDFLKEARAFHSGFYLKQLPGGLAAPADKLRGVSFQQFMSVDTFFSWYTVTGKTDYLNRFVAALYLREDESYFPTEDEKPLDLERRTVQATALPFDLKYAVMVNWLLLKAWLSRSYTHLFPEATDTRPQEGKPKARPADWLAVFDSFVGDNVASIDAYKALPCMDAFRLLNRKIKEAKKR